MNENILISSLTTMRMGGVARYVLEVESPNEVVDAYGFADTYHMPAFVMGYGANTLGHDEGFPGVIIINRMRGITETALEDGSGTLVRIMGGEYWDDVVACACGKGWTGIEALSKIPGLAGAAPVQNIGAYGQEIADTLVSVEVFDTASRQFRTLSHGELRFGYRQSIFNTTERNRHFVIAMTLKLAPGQMARPYYRSMEDFVEVNEWQDFSPAGVREVVSRIRAEKLPDPAVVPSAGSFFKNLFVDEATAERVEALGVPVHWGENIHRIDAAWLVEHAGFKGQLLHGIRVSEKAPLVLINESAKSFKDLAAARDEIVGRVYDMYGLWLEQEPVEIGF